MLPEVFTPQYLAQLELLKIHSRRAYLGSRQGGHVSLKRGHGLEFSDFREYELGDSPRHIDWGLYGRTDKLYVKRFQEEQDLPVLIILDSSASMNAIPSDAKWEFACNLTLSLTYVGLIQQDTVTIAPLGEKILPRYNGARSIHRAHQALSRVKPAGVRQLDQEVRAIASRLSAPGKVFLISDLLVEFEIAERALNALRGRNLDITVIQVLGANDRDPLPKQEAIVARDSETAERVELNLDNKSRRKYQLLLDQHQQQLKDFCHSHQILFSVADSSTIVSNFIVERLPELGLLR